jgi:hypothetical protein
MIDLSLLFKGLAQNILLFFSLAFLYSNLRSLIGFAPRFIQGVVNGLAFALIAIVGMLMRIELLPGSVIDGRIIMVGIAGAYGGPCHRHHRRASGRPLSYLHWRSRLSGRMCRNSERKSNRCGTLL